MTKGAPILSDAEAAKLRAQLAAHDTASAAKAQQEREAKLKPLTDLVASSAFAEVEAAALEAQALLADETAIEPHLRLLTMGLQRVREGLQMNRPSRMDVAVSATGAAAIASA
jgi:hypothetical protein